MSAAELVHLHVHSEFSMLDGAIRLPALVDKVRSLGMPAVALTDHDNMHGAVRFYRACKAAEVAPILGCEVAFTPGDRTDPANRRAHHLVLLAGSQTGYENLVRLVSRGWVEGGARPRIDFEVLREHSEGVVGMSACMGGYVAQEILEFYFGSDSTDNDPTDVHLGYSSVTTSAYGDDATFTCSGSTFSCY